MTHTTPPIKDFSPFAALSSPVVALIYLLISLYLAVCAGVACKLANSKVRPDHPHRRLALFPAALGFTVLVALLAVPAVLGLAVWALAGSWILARRRRLVAWWRERRREGRERQERLERLRIWHRDLDRGVLDDDATTLEGGNGSIRTAGTRFGDSSDTSFDSYSSTLLSGGGGAASPAARHHSRDDHSDSSSSSTTRRSRHDRDRDDRNGNNSSSSVRRLLAPVPDRRDDGSSDGSSSSDGGAGAEPPFLMLPPPAYLAPYVDRDTWDSGYSSDIATF
ncbi:hypothetical protein F4820DRAFT_446501 [Hypoxylon rubiginosum]|uniref:Uncharacterized protein n=1 Tax=Hypoxylon rubiginosum TaxID=110542 RepID=A0ACB9Z5D7_9PEZI|nr:hypothetical protein F4820DRAFT_446501 [Hypoxylon rubiginosum]